MVVTVVTVVVMTMEVVSVIVLARSSLAFECLSLMFKLLSI